MPDLVISFSDDDRAAVDQFVHAIVAAKPNIRRAHFDDEERLRNERAGKLAEVAFARAFGHPVNWTVGQGGDGADFWLEDGSTVDTKSVAVVKNLDYDFALPLGPDELVCDYYVQVLVPTHCREGIITGGISRQRFLQIAKPQPAWAHRGAVTPLVVLRSQLSDRYPSRFYGTRAFARPLQ